MNNSTDKITIVDKFVYGLGDLGCGMSNGLIASFFLLFCTDTFGIGAGFVGTLMLLGRFWDMINDTWVGTWSDNYDSPKGKYTPWLKIFTIPLFIVTILTFWAHPEWSQTAKCVYVFVMYFIWAFAFTLVNVPYTALTPVITQDSGERASLTGWRMCLSNITMVVTGAATMPLVGILGKGDAVKGWLLVACLFSVIGCIALYICAFRTKERIKAPKKLEGQKASVLGNAKRALKNKYFIIAAVGMFLLGFMNLGRMTVMGYFFLYTMGDMAAMSVFILVQGIGGVIGSLVGEPIVKMMRSKSKAVIIASVGIIAAVAMQYFFRAGGMAFLITSFCAQFFVGCELGIVFSTVADTVEYGLLKDGVRMDAFYGSFGYFWHKAGIALGSAGAGWMLALTGYVAGAAVQSSAVVSGINAMFFGLPILSSIVMIIAFAGYKLDFDMFDDILKQIEEKYGKQEA